MQSNSSFDLAILIAWLVMFLAIAGTVTAPLFVLWRRPRWPRLVIASPVFLVPVAGVAAVLVGGDPSAAAVAIVGLEVIWSVIIIGLAKGLRWLALWYGLVGICGSLYVGASVAITRGTL